MNAIAYTKNLMRTYIMRKTNAAQRRYMINIMRKNGIKDEPVEGEEVFVNKWKRLSSDIDPIYFRCFAHYIGANPDIISGDLCVNIIEPILNPIRYRDYYEDKNIYGKLFSKDALPRTYLRCMNGTYMDEDYNTINAVDQDSIIDRLAGIDAFIAKPTIDSCSGRGILLFRRDTNTNKFIDQNGRTFILEDIARSSNGNFIIQEKIEQSDYLAQFNPSSINTLRIVAYRSVVDNKIHVVNGLLRIGAQGSVVDNAHSGGRFVGLDDDGKLGKWTCETFGETSDSFNGINFKQSEFQIPNYAAIKDMVTKSAAQILHNRLIAFDITLDKQNKPLLIEYNIGAFSYWLFQFTQQPAVNGFADEIIDYCLTQMDNRHIMNIKL